MNSIVRANLAENRLYITIGGTITEEDLKLHSELMERECSKLKRGFTILQDLREMKVLDPALAKKSEDIKQMVLRMGPSKGAIVIKSIVSKGQLNRSYNKSTDVMEDVFFNDIDEALKYLNS